MTDNLQTLQDVVYDLYTRLTLSQAIETLNERDKDKIMKLRYLLLDIDSMLDDYTSEDAPMPDPINDVNDVCSKHHY